ncbi:MAG: hypothetical protein ACRDHS_03010 [Actinomycetota bacterium]
MTTDQDIRKRAEALGFRAEKYIGEEVWLIRNLYTDIRVAHRITTLGMIRWLEKHEADELAGRFVYRPGDVEIIHPEGD